MNRRSFLRATLAVVAAPAIVTYGNLMRPRAPALYPMEIGEWRGMCYWEGVDLASGSDQAVLSFYDGEQWPIGIIARTVWAQDLFNAVQREQLDVLKLNLIKRA